MDNLWDVVVFVQLALFAWYSYTNERRMDLAGEIFQEMHDRIKRLEDLERQAPNGPGDVTPGKTQ